MRRSYRKSDTFGDRVGYGVPVGSAGREEAGTAPADKVKWRRQWKSSPSETSRTLPTSHQPYIYNHLYDPPWCQTSKRLMWGNLQRLTSATNNFGDDINKRNVPFLDINIKHIIQETIWKSFRFNKRLETTTKIDQIWILERGILMAQR